MLGIELDIGNTLVKTTPSFSISIQICIKSWGVKFGSWVKRLEILVKIIYLYNTIIKKLKYIHVNTAQFLAGTVPFVCV